MSRLGKRPISIPASIQVDLKDEAGCTRVTVKKGNKSLSRVFPKGIKIEKKDNGLQVLAPDEQQWNLYGLCRTLIFNMVEGLEKGFERRLEINGVGYRAQTKGKMLTLNLGFSHPINFPMPENVEAKVDQNTNLILTSFDKDLLGQTCAKIRKLRPPEPYQGKGIKYQEEKIRRKEGKSAGK